MPSAAGTAPVVPIRNPIAPGTPESPASATAVTVTACAAASDGVAVNVAGMSL